MKVLAWIFGILIVILGSIYVLVFSSLGNALIAPKIEQIASQKIGMNFKFSEFKLGFSQFHIISSINGELNISAEGKYNLFSQRIDAKYKVFASSFSSLPLNLNIVGDAKGDFNNIIASGSGNLTGSNLRYVARIVDFSPLELKLDAKNLDLAQLSLIALKKPYLSGAASITADIAMQNGTQKGHAKITAPKLGVNGDLLAKEHNINLPKDFSIALNSDVLVDNGILNAISTVKSSIANADAKKTSYNIKTGELNTDFNLDIPNLANLEPIIHQKLKGSAKIAANTQIKDNKMQFLDTTINGFGGKVVTKLANNELNAQIQNIKLADILSIASLPPLAKSDIVGSAKITGLDNPAKTNGSASLQFIKGELDYKQMNALVGSDLKSNIGFIGDAKINVTKGILKLNSLINSSAIKMAMLNANYDLKSGNGDADFKANIPNLGVIFGSKATTSADIKAKIDIKKSALANADIDITGLGGSINAKLQSNTLNATLKNIQASNLFAMSTQDELFSGTINGNINLDSIDIKNLNGKGEISITNGVFNAVNLSKMLDASFPQNTKFSLNARPTFTNSVAHFTSSFNSDLGQISKFDGSYDITKKSLDADFKASIANLANLAFISGASINAPLNATGKLSMANGAINANVNTDIFNSSTTANYANDALAVNMQNAKIESILSAIGYDKFYLGTANAQLNYSIKNELGEFSADILQGSLAQTGLTSLINAFFKRDVTNEVYENGKVQGAINKGLIAFNAAMHSEKSDINVTNATVNTKTKALNIPIKANFEKTDIAVDITGTTDKPDYKLNSAYLQEKIMDKALDKLIKNDEKRDTTKQILEGLKGLKLF